MDDDITDNFWGGDARRLHDDYSDSDMPSEGDISYEDEEVEREPLTDEQKMLCTPAVRGYSLKDKLWLNFFVDSMHEIQFNKKAFESLVLPDGKKDIILGFANTPTVYRHQFDDYVSGKGRGMIMLLYGPPGTGKTLTAESIAEEMETPLYVMSAGDLGLDPSRVEVKLQEVLDMCTRWNAILLLDEADVFLEERKLHELERNKLVSIFLRVLEWFQGVLVLTTNRVETFDAAFESRIHISIGYKELDQTSRRTVWANFLKKHDETQAAVRAKLLSPDETDKEKEECRKRTLPHSISEHQIDELAKKPLNGRQIKNMLKSAQLLSMRHGEELNKGHIETVLKCTQHLYDASKGKDSTLGSMFH